VDPNNCGNGVCDPDVHECVPPPCARDADCAANQACGPLLVGNALELRCVPAIGRGRDSASCQSNLECAARSCIGASFCYSACNDVADCQSGRCDPITFSTDELPGQEFVFNSCTPPPQLCQANAQCDAGEVCVYQGEDPQAPSTPLVACANPLPGATIGQPCAQDNQCASQVCLNQGVCWGPCRPALGAQDCPANQRCYINSVYVIFDRGTPQASDDGHFGLPGCMPDRGSDTPCPLGVCPGNEVCVPQTDQNYTGFDFLCRTPAGAGLSGAPCAQDADCRSNTCLAGIGVCLGVCNPNDARTCANGTVCISANFTVWDSGTPANSADDVVAPINICVP
jgi:hypothetical protein